MPPALVDRWSSGQGSPALFSVGKQDKEQKPGHEPREVTGARVALGGWAGLGEAALQRGLQVMGEPLTGR